ncbi:hypothetical protein ASPZODRAFT_128650 [Penicilliopsis zonata CBS 506.65]|uniref:Uncharacterized protein n=1 Tax=Penicilliopsis zonata CBS 506.65 TaxID=1073090 RepID=A0A1L9SSG4_9EURO|nr:hypothetical protein ASPZODRAFT_128650 [Penicilliopsis zonata CBS 506.65]OJJ50054.1 hypothetical protein ASPZODRAFT_128650 [Penicilliopsis zonata CBS 506.65]
MSESQESPSFLSPANQFLQREVYRLVTEPGLRSLPPNPERDFLTLTWGPIVFRTTYAPESRELFPIFLRQLNEEVRRSLPRTIPGSPSQMTMLERTYSSKVFTDQSAYENVDEAAIQEAFHDWKISLGLPSIKLPVRLNTCLMVDDGILARLTEVVNSSMLAEKDADVSSCPVKIVEENFPDLSKMDYCGNTDYQGWTTVAFSSLVEVYDGIGQGKCLADYHRPNLVYQGKDTWS